MQRNGGRSQRAAWEEGLALGSGLSAGVIVLLIVAASTVSLGFARLPDGLLDIGVVGVGLFLAVSARICQAREQHLALCRALDGLRPTYRHRVTQWPSQPPGEGGCTAALQDDTPTHLTPPG